MVRLFVGYLRLDEKGILPRFAENRAAFQFLHIEPVNRKYMKYIEQRTRLVRDTEGHNRPIGDIRRNKRHSVLFSTDDIEACIVARVCLDPFPKDFHLVEHGRRGTSDRRFAFVPVFLHRRPLPLYRKTIWVSLGEAPSPKTGHIGRAPADGNIPREYPPSQSQG